MKYFCYSLLVLFFLCTSCASVQEKGGESTFVAYLQQRGNSFVLDTVKPGTKGEKKIKESFSHIDLAAAELNEQEQGRGEVLYKNVAKVLDDLYSEYFTKKRTEPLTTLEKKLYSDVEGMLAEAGNNSDKFLVLEARKEAERRFDLEVKNQGYDSKVRDELKSFVDTYTQGFFIEGQSNPAEFQQYNLDHISQFKTCFYLLMSEAIQK